MQKSISRFLKAVLVLTTFLLVVSIIYVGKSSNELDADSMLMAMLLLVFSSVATIAVSILLFKMRRNK